MFSADEKQKELEQLREEIRALELLRVLDRDDAWISVEQFKGRQLVSIQQFHDFHSAYQHYKYISQQPGYTYKMNYLITGDVK